MRIQIRGSIPLTNGSGSGCGSCYFRQWSSRCQQKKFFCLLLFDGTFRSFFKDNKFIEMSQNSRNQCFSNYFCFMMEGSGSAKLPKKTKIHADPDPPPWVHQIRYLPECPAPVARVAGGVLDEWVGRGPGLPAVRRQVHPDYPPSAARPRVPFTHPGGVVFRKLTKNILRGPVLRNRNYFFRLRLRLHGAANPNCG